MKKLIHSLLVAFLALWIQPAFAYIDPGSGSAIMTAIIGFFVAIGLAVKTYWYKIKALFSGKKKDSAAPTDSNKENK